MARNDRSTASDDDEREWARDLWGLRPRRQPPGPSPRRPSSTRSPEPIQPQAPTRAWCIDNAPCDFCRTRGHRCAFALRRAGSRQDAATCDVCREKHLKCSIKRLWSETAGRVPRVGGRETDGEVEEEEDEEAGGDVMPSATALGKRRAATPPPSRIKRGRRAGPPRSADLGLRRTMAVEVDVDAGAGAGMRAGARRDAGVQAAERRHETETDAHVRRQRDWLASRLTAARLSELTWIRRHRCLLGSATTDWPCALDGLEKMCHACRGLPEIAAARRSFREWGAAHRRFAFGVVGGLERVAVNVVEPMPDAADVRAEMGSAMARDLGDAMTGDGRVIDMTTGRARRRLD